MSQAQFEKLESRIRVLEDIEEIKKLRYRYALYLTEGRFDELVDLFTEDAIAEYPDSVGGTQKGKEELRKFYRTIHPPQLFAVHNPIIEVNGDVAHGEWRVEGVGVGRQKASWRRTKFVEEYVRENGTWKIRKLTSNHIMPVAQIKLDVE